MKDEKDRTDYARLVGLRDEAIDYSDIPPLDSAEWTRWADAADEGVHVIRRKSHWVVVKHGSTQPKSTHRTQAKAIEAARDWARSLRTKLHVHRVDGRIRDTRDYCNGVARDRSAA